MPPPNEPHPIPVVKLKASTAINAALVLLAVVAFVVLATRGSDSPGIEVVRSEALAGVDEIRVDVRGAVASPGVVTLQPGDRVQDALALAGGALPDADLSQVNLALRVRDEDVLHVPTEGNLIASTLVDINTASQHDLEALPGIGPVRARAIIEARPYASTDDLVKRAVIPAGVYEQIRLLTTAR